MIEFFTRLFDTTDFPSRWNCGTWAPFEGWLLILSDLAIFGAYAAIPVSICFYVLAKRREVVFPRLYWLFAAFILSCGLTHLVDAIIFWEPLYRLSALLKFITAIVSWATAIVLIRFLPTALNLPGAARLNVDLQREVEERKRSEAALRESSTRVSLAIEHSKLGDWWWDIETDLATFSPRGVEIFGLSRSQISWTELRTHLHEEDRDRAQAAVQQSLAGQTDYDVEYRAIRPSDGEEVWISARGRAEYAPDGRAWRMVGIVEDVTERKCFETERERLLTSERAARSEAERTNRMKDDFLATLSHELRTPLHSILGWSHLLQNESSQEHLAEGLRVIERNVRAQSQMVDELLDMNRIITGKVRLDVQSVDPEAVIRAAIDAVRPSAVSRHVRIVTAIDPVGPAILGDPARLQQVVWNLLTNAIKFTPAGGQVEIATASNDSHLEIRVTDTGVGIPAAFLPFVFDRFRQADSSTSRKHGGLGLGLAIVKHLVEMHGGTVEADSPGENLGATFRVELPLPAAHLSRPKTRDRAAPEAAWIGNDAASPDLANVQILLVDDQPDSLDMLRFTLERQGAIVTTAGSGPDALAALELKTFDTLVSDIGMPGMDGFELLRRVRSLRRERGGDVPAIALTAFARSEDRRRAMECGFDMFVSKPVEPGEFLAVVRRYATRTTHEN